MHFLYSLLLGAALIASAPWWLWKMRGKYRFGLGERLGRVPARLKTNAQTAVWIHAVSVGEVLAITKLVAELERAAGVRVFVSTTTATGQKLARDKFGDGRVFYFPVDFQFAIRKYLRALKPKMVVLAETEFWPNFLHECAESGARVAVVNARISDRSLPRYRYFRDLMARPLWHVSMFLAQSEEDARRLVAIGAEAERVRVAGNLKFDPATAVEKPVVAELRAALARDGAGPVLVCGSTVEGEEEMLLDWVLGGVRETYPKTCCVLAPRHPERFDAVAAMVERSGARLVRRSKWQGERVDDCVFLLDTLGELAAVYELADVVFVGGSMVERGGHSIIEPAQFGKAIVVGPHTENFRDVMRLFLAENAAKQLRFAAVEGLGKEMLDLLGDRATREKMGTRALQVFRAQQGATQRTVDALRALLEAE